MKKITLSLLLALVVTLSIPTSALAATGKTVTFYGGDVTDGGKWGTIIVELTNIVKTKNVKMTKKELMTYLDDEEAANNIIHYNDYGEATTLLDFCLNNKIPTYYADEAPVTITTKQTMSTFYGAYKGADGKADFIPKYYEYYAYYDNPTNPKVFTKQPEGYYLFAPETIWKLNEPGKYIIALADDGLISDTPPAVICVVIGDTPDDTEEIKETKVKSLSINKSKATLTKGKTTTLKATAKPSDATDKGVTWKSSNTKVATVDKNGKVTAKAKGTATITATAKDGSKKKVTCKITVKNPVKVTKVTLNKSTLSLAKGKSSTLVANIAPKNATTKTVTWKSSNKKVATVNKNGKVTAKAKGKATITATAKDGSKKKVTCRVTVK